MNIQQLQQICEEWLGTPWRHQVAVKQLGCDCIHFVGGVMEEMELVKFSKVKVPNYPPDWHLHNTREMLLEGLKREFNAVEIPLDKLEDGDIILFHYGKAASHAAIYINGFLYHCIRPGGVAKCSWQDKQWRSRARFALRIMK